MEPSWCVYMCIRSAAGSPKRYMLVPFHTTLMHMSMPYAASAALPKLVRDESPKQLCAAQDQAAVRSPDKPQVERKKNLVFFFQAPSKQVSQLFKVKMQQPHSGIAIAEQLTALNEPCIIGTGHLNS